MYSLQEVCKDFLDESTYQAQVVGDKYTPRWNFDDEASTALLELIEDCQLLNSHPSICIPLPLDARHVERHLLYHALGPLLNDFTLLSAPLNEGDEELFHGVKCELGQLLHVMLPQNHPHFRIPEPTVPKTCPSPRSSKDSDEVPVEVLVPDSSPPKLTKKRLSSKSHLSGSHRAPSPGDNGEDELEDDRKVSWVKWVVPKVSYTLWNVLQR